MRPRFLQLLQALDRHAVDFVVVGGVAAILEGAPITTLDLDFVYRVEAGNLERLAATLAELEARYRDPAGRQIEPTATRLEANRVNLLETRLGLLDAMQEIGAAWTYDDLFPRSRARAVADLTVRVLELAAVIESKEVAGREKDLAMLPVLRRTLEMLKSNSQA
ncbi:MAG: hypothetical protein ACRD2Z_03995 [Thermoanaerobaculia bacterium]